MEIELPKLARHDSCLLGRPRTVGVDHQRDPFTGRVPSRRHFQYFGLVDLNGVISFRTRLRDVLADEFRIAVFQQAGIAGHARAGSATQQTMKGNTGSLTRDIPERDIKCGERKDGDAIATEEVQFLLHVARNTGDIS